MDPHPLTPAEQRRRDARLRDELSRSSALHESIEGQRLVDEFVDEARRRGIAPEPLKARLLDGHEVKTDRTGWYIRLDKSIGIGEDGHYYVLTVPGGWMERVRGVKLEPTPPPLIVGRGGRDGDSGDLSFFLAKRLEQG